MNPPLGLGAPKKPEDIISRDVIVTAELNQMPDGSSLAPRSYLEYIVCDVPVFAQSPLAFYPDLLEAHVIPERITPVPSETPPVKSYMTEVILL